MTSKQENLPAFKRSNLQYSLSQARLFPPLPIMPPSDVDKGTDSMKKAQSACARQKDARPRRFGTKITNTPATNDERSGGYTEQQSLLPAAIITAQKISHENQIPPSSVKILNVDAKLRWEKCEPDPASLEDPSFFSLSKNTENYTDPRPSTEKTITFSESDSNTQRGRTIWSVTPSELSILAKEATIIMRGLKEPTQKLSYAEASKRNLSHCVEERPSQMSKTVEDEQPPPVFKKYYGLPIIPSYEPLHSWDTQYASARKKMEEGPISLKKIIKSSDKLDYCETFGLSANTPVFHPRPTTETNELIQLLSSSFTSKKVAPHMDWWPVTWIFSVGLFVAILCVKCVRFVLQGDWKCTKCGNHVLLSGV